MLLIGDKSQHVRHVVISLLQLVECLIDAVPDAQGRELEGFLEDRVKLDQFAPMPILDVFSDQLWRVRQSEQGCHINHSLQGLHQLSPIVLFRIHSSELSQNSFHQMHISEKLSKVLVAEVMACPFDEGVALLEGVFVVGGVEE